MPEDFDEQEGSMPHEEHPDENTLATMSGAEFEAFRKKLGAFIDKKSKAAPSKGPKTYRGIPLVGKSELEKLGFDTSDELVISPGRKKKPAKSPEN